MSFAVFMFESLIAVLLVAAIYMCWRVDQRMKALRSGQDGMRQTITELNEAVERARASLAALDRAAKEHGQSLHDEVKRAEVLSEELAFLNGAGERRANRLANPRREERSVSSSTSRPDSDHERDEASARLLDALKAMR